MSSKIASFEQDKEGVTITLGDNTTVRGDILVGADGAHSAVRKHLYETLDKQGLLPKSDTEAMSVGYVSLLGTTDVLDPAKYPGLLKDDCETSFIIGDKKTPYTVSPGTSLLSFGPLEEKHLNRMCVSPKLCRFHGQYLVGNIYGPRQQDLLERHYSARHLLYRR